MSGIYLQLAPMIRNNSVQDVLFLENNSGLWPLTCAVRHNKLECVSLLLSLTTSAATQCQKAKLQSSGWNIAFFAPLLVSKAVMLSLPIVPVHDCISELFWWRHYLDFALFCDRWTLSFGFFWNVTWKTITGGRSCDPCAGKFVCYQCVSTSANCDVKRM